MEKGNPLVLLVGVEIDTAAMDNSMKIILKTKNISFLSCIFHIKAEFLKI